MCNKSTEKAKCQNCDKIFLSNEYLKSHLAQVHEWNDSFLLLPIKWIHFDVSDLGFCQFKYLIENLNWDIEKHFWRNFDSLEIIYKSKRQWMIQRVFLAMMVQSTSLYIPPKSPKNTNAISVKKYSKSKEVCEITLQPSTMELDNIDAINVESHLHSYTFCRGNRKNFIIIFWHFLTIFLCYLQPYWMRTRRH